MFLRNIHLIPPPQPVDSILSGSVFSGDHWLNYFFIITVIHYLNFCHSRVPNWVIKTVVQLSSRNIHNKLNSKSTATDICIWFRNHNIDLKGKHARVQWRSFCTLENWSAVSSVVSYLTGLKINWPASQKKNRMVSVFPAYSTTMQIIILYSANSHFGEMETIY